MPQTATYATPEDLALLQKQIDDLSTRVTALEDAGEPVPQPPPTVAILSPPEGETFGPGEVVTVTGSGNNLVWAADLFSDGLGDFASGVGPSFTFTVPPAALNGMRVQVRLTGDGGIAERFYDVVAVAPEPIPPPTGSVPNWERPPTVSGDVAKVAGTTYRTMQAAFNALPSGGGVVEVLPGGHVGADILGVCNVPLELRGIRDGQNRIPWLDGEKRSVSKCIIEANKDIIVRDVGFQSVVNSSNNAAGIRHGLNCLLIRLNYCGFRDLQNGILTNTSTPVKHICEWTDVLFDGNGVNPGSHGCYIGFALKAVLTRARFINGKGGMAMKSRAWETHLIDVEVLQAADSRAIDLPNGGILRVLRGRYVKPSSSPQQELIGIHNEEFSPGNNDGRSYDYRIEGAILENYRSSGKFVVNKLHSANVPVYVIGGTRLGGAVMEGNVIVQ